MGDRKCIKPMTNAIDPIASIVRRKLSSHSLAFHTNPARMTLTLTCASRIKTPTLNPTSQVFAAPSSIEPSLTSGESFSGRIVSHKLVSHETGLVCSTAASSTPLRASERGLTTARDDMLEDGARTGTVPALSVFHIASHRVTLNALSTSALASASSYIQRPYRQPMLEILPRHPLTFLSVARQLSLLLLLPLLLRRMIMIGSAPSCAMDIQRF
jgi:hypothetical protein